MAKDEPRPLQRVLGMVVVVAVSLAAPGCCSIIHQTMQEVSISSQPTKAQVIIDAEQRGETPVVVELKRKNSHTIRVALEGYEPYEIALIRKVSGWVWGNIIFGGLIGLAVDAGNGAMYKLTPDQVEATLSESAAQVLYRDREMFIFVTLRSAPNWVRVGALVPEASDQVQ